MARCLGWHPLVSAAIGSKQSCRWCQCLEKDVTSALTAVPESKRRIYKKSLFRKACEDGRGLPLSYGHKNHIGCACKSNRAKSVRRRVCVAMRLPRHSDTPGCFRMGDDAKNNSPPQIRNMVDRTSEGLSLHSASESEIWLEHSVGDTVICCAGTCEISPAPSVELPFVSSGQP